MFGCFFKNMIRLLDEAEALDQLSRELHIRVSEIVASLDGKFCYPVCPISFAHHYLGPVPHVDTLLTGTIISMAHQTDTRNFAAVELRQLDISLRSNVSSVTQMKVF